MFFLAQVYENFLALKRKEFFYRKLNKVNPGGKSMKKLICLVAMLFAVTNAFALPKGYTELEWIKLAGRQYIDTGVVLKSTTNIEHVMKAKLNTAGSDFQTFAGFMASGTTPRYGFSAYSGSWMIGINTTKNGSRIDADEHTLHFITTTSSQTLYDTDGKTILVTGDLTGSFADNTLSLYIGARHEPGAVNNYVKGYIGYTYLKQNGRMLYEYIPAKRDSDGVVGMYDMVSQKFLAGSGGFEAGPVASGGRSGDGKIVIATKKYNENVFAPVSQTLAGLRSNISDIVDDVYAQATDIADLNSQKQTRPATGCPAGKKCLLVKTPAGQNAWYEIADCGEDMFLSNVGSNITFGGTYYGGYKDGSTAERACAASGANCANNGWMRSFANGVVYGEAIRLSVAQSTGTVVELPSNIQNDPNGRNCLCRATGYRLKNGNSYGSMVSVTTDKWYVSHGMGYSGSTCQHNCAFDGDQQPDGGIDVPYYAAISNTCGGSVASAAMCTYNRWFASIIQENLTTGVIGYDGNNGDHNTGLCANPSGTDATWCASSSTAHSTVETSWCNNDGTQCYPNSWIVNYSMNASATEGANNPKLYGRAFCTDMSTAGMVAGTLLTASQIGTKSIEGYSRDSDSLACVCQVQGYKNASASNMTSVQSNYIYVDKNGKCHEYCQNYCANYFKNNPHNDLIRELAGTCPL